MTTKTRIECYRCGKESTACARYLSEKNYCPKCLKWIKQMDKEAEELGYKCDECPNEHECIHISKGLGQNPTWKEVIKYTLQQRILKTLREKYGKDYDSSVDQNLPILKEKCCLEDKRLACHLLYGWIEHFSLGQMINFADALGVDYELRIIARDTDPNYYGNKKKEEVLLKKLASKKEHDNKKFFLKVAFDKMDERIKRIEKGECYFLCGKILKEQNKMLVGKATHIKSCLDCKNKLVKKEVEKDALIDCPPFYWEVDMTEPNWKEKLNSQMVELATEELETSDLHAEIERRKSLKKVSKIIKNY